MKCPHQSQVKPVRLIREAEGGADELERRAERGGGEESAGPSGTRGRGSRGRAQVSVDGNIEVRGDQRGRGVRVRGGGRARRRAITVFLRLDKH